MSKPALRFYDTKTSEPYLMGVTGRTVSVGELGFVALSYLPREGGLGTPKSLQPGPFIDFALKVLQSSDNKGFTAISPITHRVRAESGDTLSAAVIIEGSGLMAFEPTWSELVRQFEIRRRFVSHEEWTIGVSHGALRVPDAKGPLSSIVPLDIDYFLESQASLIGGVSVFRGEIGEHLLLIRPYSGMMMDIEELRRVL